MDDYSNELLSGTPLEFEAFVRDKLGVDIDGSHAGAQQLCRAFIRGHCPRGASCPLKHTYNPGVVKRRAAEQTIVCKHWLRGLCKKGDSCEFLHQYDLKRMPECWFFSKFGECSNPECLYLHLDPKSKTHQCAWYARGFCRHGPDCRSRHVRDTVCPQYLSGFCPLGPNCQYGHPKYDATMAH